MINNDDIDLDGIAKRSTDQALNSYPKASVSKAAKIGLLMAAFVLAINAVIGVYNSLVLRREVSCNQDVTHALNKVSDQNRDLYSDTFRDILLGDPHTGQPLTKEQKTALWANFQKSFKASSINRAAVLSATCH